MITKPLLEKCPKNNYDDKIGLTYFIPSTKRKYNLFDEIDYDPVNYGKSSNSDIDFPNSTDQE